jgi:hypothetical protein
LEPSVSATNTHSDDQVERLVKRRRVATACPWVLQHDGDVGVVEDGRREVASLEERLFVEAEVENARCPLVYIGPSTNVILSYEGMRAWSVDGDLQEKEEDSQEIRRPLEDVSVIFIRKVTKAHRPPSIRLVELIHIRLMGGRPM